MKDFKLGLIARCDNGGLGIESVEFAKHLQPDKVLCVLAGYDNYPERFPGAIKTDLHPTDGQMRDFFSGLDVAFAVENFYNPKAFEIAREMGVRTVVKANFEWVEDWMTPDLMVYPNSWHAPAGAAIIPLPIDPDRFKFRERVHAKTFLHVIGHDAGYDRNGTAILAQAMPFIKSDIRLIVRSQIPIWRWKEWRQFGSYFEDKRVTVIDKEVEDRAELYQDADILVIPRRYGGQSLTMEEAAMCGLPILTTFMEPQMSMFIGGAPCIFPGELSRIRIKQEVEYANPNPQDLAMMIDYMAGADPLWIKALSRMVHRAVANRSWEPWIEALRPR